MLETGFLLDGKYKILNIIGHGGMSLVYLAINERANKTWAVKEIRKDGGSDLQTVRQGLMAETEMLMKLNHLNLPSIVDVIDREDSFYIVMDYIEGRNLLDILQQEGPQPPGKVIDWACQLCDVLGYLHSRRPPIIYRDMKPSNVMLRPDGQIILIDFGTAREYKYSGEKDTAWLGTRGYAAPEQFGVHGQTDGRTDIYNLGATMYHLITGISPAETNFSIPPAGETCPELKGSGIEKVIGKCCRPDPEDRFQTCAELLYALEHVHDEDDRVIRQRNLYCGCFLTCLFLSLAMLTAGFGFRRAFRGTQEQLYKSFILEAASAERFEDKAGEYRKAINILPSEPEGWVNLKEAVEELPSISNSQYAAIVECIRDTGTGRAGGETENLQHLLRDRPEVFADFNYRMGMLIFFKKQSGGEICSRMFFRNALDSSVLDQRETGIAKTMYSLADQYVKLLENEADDLGRESGHVRSFEVESGYRDCWESFEALAQDLKGLETVTGNMGYPIAVCERIAEELQGSSLIRFTVDGVDEKSIRGVLKTIRDYMEGIDISVQTDNTRERVAGVRKKVHEAEKCVDRRFTSIVGRMAEDQIDKADGEAASRE